MFPPGSCPLWTSKQDEQNVPTGRWLSVGGQSFKGTRSVFVQRCSLTSGVGDPAGRGGCPRGGYWDVRFRSTGRVRKLPEWGAGLQCDTKAQVE